MINALLFISVALNLVLILVLGFTLGRRQGEEAAKKEGMSAVTDAWSKVASAFWSATDKKMSEIPEEKIRK
jgi:hypothetical protein